MFFNKVEKDIVSFTELHIRHLNLLVNLKTISTNNWFYKLAIINTLEDIKLFLTYLEKSKSRCIIAIQNRKIIGYLYIQQLNEKRTCLRINPPEVIYDNLSISKRELVLKLIQNSISHTNLKTSSWIISADIYDEILISCSRELGFQPLQKTKLWSNNKPLISEDYSIKENLVEDFKSIDKNNVKKVLNFIRSSESILIRNILDLDQIDIFKRNDKNSGAIIINNQVIFTILRDIRYKDNYVYSLISGASWDERLNSILKPLIIKIASRNPLSIFKTYAEDNNLNSYLEDLNLVNFKNELILVRDSLIKRDNKSVNKINNSLETILNKINPKGNTFPAPFP